MNGSKLMFERAKEEISVKLQLPVPVWIRLWHPAVWKWKKKLSERLSQAFFFFKFCHIKI